MSASALADAHLLRSHLRRQLDYGSSLAQSPALSCLTDNGPDLHLAVMSGPYLDYVLSGAKVVESRFHRVRQAPLFSAKIGDIIAFKDAGGPVRAMAVVSAAEFVDLNRISLESVRMRFQSAISATHDEFWLARANAKWVSLLSLEQVRPIAPVAISKRDRRAWIRYAPVCPICTGDQSPSHPSLAL